MSEEYRRQLFPSRRIPALMPELYRWTKLKNSDSEFILCSHPHVLNVEGKGPNAKCAWADFQNQFYGPLETPKRPAPLPPSSEGYSPRPTPLFAKWETGVLGFLVGATFTLVFLAAIGGFK
jgi:hypothetical protein